MSSHHVAMCRSACIAALALLPAVAVAAGLSSSSRVGPTGVGPVAFGATPAQAAAHGVRFVATAPVAGSSCFYLHPPEPSGLRFMVENGTIRRAEIFNPALRTTEGLAVGDAVAKIVSTYGTRAQIAPDKYDPSTQTATIAPKGGADAKYRIIFKLKGGVVQAIIAGALPQVEYVEGCS